MKSDSNQWFAFLRVLRRRSIWGPLGLALLAFGAIHAAGERDEAERQASTKAPKKRAKVARVAKDQRTREVESTVNRNLSQLAEGAKVRIVWIEDPNRKAADPFATSDALRLAGWDSQGGGYRRIIEEPGNYGRPLLTPSGREVIYTDKQVQHKRDKKHLTPVIHLIDWSGENDRVLGPGFAVEVSHDPEAKRTWVYALEKIIPAKSLSMSGTTLIRFPLDEPSRRERVWTRTPLSVDNFQLSRDGTRFAGLFPWPDAGVGEVTTGRWHKLDIGCWPSMAPDNSYVMWVFDGLHRKLRMYAPEGGRRWTVDLSAAPDMRGREAYHPRWSNHPRYAVFTGPYTSKKRSRNAISAGGLTAEVYVSKFSESLERMESFVRLTHNTAGDFYPDVWVAGGEIAELTSFRQKPAPSVRTAEPWPPEPEQMQFAWQDLKAENEIPGSAERIPCHLEAHGLGRYTPFLGALLDGGWFEADDASNAALAVGIRKMKAFTLQALITEWPGPPSETVQPLVSWRAVDGFPYFQVARAGRQLVVEFGRGPTRTTIKLDHPVTAGKAHAFAISVADELCHFSMDGRVLGADQVLREDVFAKWPDGRLVVGDPQGQPDGRRATLERLTVHSLALAQTHLAARAELDLAAARDRTWPVPVRLRARLLEATEPTLEKLDTYHRMLVDHTYEVLEVLEGNYEPKRIVVLHWAVLDDRPVPGIPREEGREYELRLDPAAAHPELDGELTDVTSNDFDLPMYLEVATPPPPAK